MKQKKNRTFDTYISTKSKPYLKCFEMLNRNPDGLVQREQIRVKNLVKLSL